AYQLNNDQFNRGMSLYNSANQDLWQNKNFNADQAYKTQQQNNWQRQYDTSNSQWQKQFDTSNSQWQKTFDFNKTNADREYQLKLQEMARAAAKASRGGSSGRSGGSYSGGSSGSVNSLLTGTKAQKANASNLLNSIYNDAQGGNNYDALLKYRNAMAASSDKTQQAAVQSIKNDIG
ncbi:hypothetical protein RZS08_64440, partial [Arthrospira platensis SPKY1]|nr:hypothetical protein [Arthrospira platensis SPKY1]